MNHDLIADTLRSDFRVRGTGRSHGAIAAAIYSDAILVVATPALRQQTESKTKGLDVVSVDGLYNATVGNDRQVVFDHLTLERAYLDLYDRLKKVEQILEGKQ